MLRKWGVEMIPYSCLTSASLRVQNLEQNPLGNYLRCEKEEISPLSNSPSLLFLNPQSS